MSEMLLTSFNNILLIVGLVSCLLYFYYSKPHTGVLGVVSKIGIYFLMISFGASFGYTVMSRISLAVGRAQEVLVHPVAAVVSILLVGAGIAVWRFTTREPAT